MKLRTLLMFLACGLMLFASCSRPECQTRTGKKKRKFYNSFQYR
jgi:hypothetical protein